jgi:hypothetical protein
MQSILAYFGSLTPSGPWACSPSTRAHFALCCIVQCQSCPQLQFSADVSIQKKKKKKVGKHTYTHEKNPSPGTKEADSIVCFKVGLEGVGPVKGELPRVAGTSLESGVIGIATCKLCQPGIPSPEWACSGQSSILGWGQGPGWGKSPGLAMPAWGLALGGSGCRTLCPLSYLLFSEARPVSCSSDGQSGDTCLRASGGAQECALKPTVRQFLAAIWSCLAQSHLLCACPCLRHVVLLGEGRPAQDSYPSR